VIKAVFFDWFGTLARYDPPREELQRRVLGELGVSVPRADISRALLVADREFYDSVAATGAEPDREERARRALHHQEALMRQLGVHTTEELVARTLARLRQLSPEMTFVLFEDVMPTLMALKERRITAGLLTNWRGKLQPTYTRLGIGPYLDFAITSEEVGAGKPHPDIFLAALKRAAVEAGEALHVGDQYSIDVAGARSAGIPPILLDRADIHRDITDCPRIRRLPELIEYLG
jgi:putative hydrolase of the HAD superfamily